MSEYTPKMLRALANKLDYTDGFQGRVAGEMETLADAWEAREAADDVLLGNMQITIAALESEVADLQVIIDYLEGGPGENARVLQAARAEVEELRVSRARVEAVAAEVIKAGGEAAHIAGLAETLTDNVMKPEIARRADALTKRLELAALASSGGSR